MNINEIKSILQSPATGSPCTDIKEDTILFGSDAFPLVDQVPVLIDNEKSLFNTADICARKVTTQSKVYNTNSSLKNKLRRSILPQITKDYHFEKRYRQLAGNMAGKKILIIGAGNKSPFYKEIFKESTLIISDVHIQFDVDIVLDAHQFPFKDGSIDMIIAGQVIEHTIRPWQIAAEMERVVKPGGFIHVESPMLFSFHAIPYDFYRFTFMGMRSLFPKSKIATAFITEGAGNVMGLVNSESLINSFSGKYSRRIATGFARLAFGWFKWFDKYKNPESKSPTRWSLPMGIGMTLERDNQTRTDKEIMADYYSYFNIKAK